MISFNSSNNKLSIIITVESGEWRVESRDLGRNLNQSRSWKRCTTTQHHRSHRGGRDERVLDLLLVTRVNPLYNNLLLPPPTCESDRESRTERLERTRDERCRGRCEESKSRNQVDTTFLCLGRLVPVRWMFWRRVVLALCFKFFERGELWRALRALHAGRVARVCSNLVP